MASFIGFVKRNMTIANPPAVPKDQTALRFGLLGASRIAVNAVILPAKSHAGVIVAAVASRERTKAEQYAKQHSIPVVHTGADAYQSLIDDTTINVIYNALPNSMHFEWTIRALRAGKHVLLEKPCANTAAEARVLFDTAAAKGLVLLEGYAYTLHPAIQRVKEIVDSDELGKIKSVHTEFCLPKGIIPKNDIREGYELGGGATMDLGVYTLDSIRYVTSTNPIEIVSAQATKHIRDDKTDRRMAVTYSFPSSVSASSLVDIQEPGWGPFGLIPQMVKNSMTIKFEGGEVYHYGLTLPHIYHKIKVTPKNGKSRVEKAYAFKSGLGEPWWSSYRYQLEAFVNKVQNSETHAWRSPEESVVQMEWIEQIYTKAGLPVRPSSSFDSSA
ncbi:NAD-P-binding protein [Cytidiella melzeri]|nr:NAD-P-binding protein [Cytidiella melzeri]